MRIDQTDLLEPAGYAAGQPWEALRWLQENDPVSWHESTRGPGYWVVTRYNDLKAVEGDSKAFSSQPTTVVQDGREHGDDSHRMLIFEDMPNHTTHRRFMGQEMTPAAVRRLRPQVEVIAADIINEVIERGECDLVWDIAGNLASYTMAELLGISRADAVDLYDASELMNNAATFEGGEGLEAMQHLGQYAHEAWTDRRAHPREDAVTRLATGEVRGVPMDELQFTLDFLHLISAAGDTTRNVVAGGMAALFDNPDQRKIMFEGDDAVVASGVEEMLRWVSPIVYQGRTANYDTTVGEQQILKGQKVASFYGIANRDPAVFDDPWTFNALRYPNPHVAFGYGAHFCLGSHLARLELNAMFRALPKRIPDLELAGPVLWNHPEWPIAPIVVGPKAMPVRFSPGRPLAA